MPFSSLRATRPPFVRRGDGCTPRRAFCWAASTPRARTGASRRGPTADWGRTFMAGRGGGKGKGGGLGCRGHPAGKVFAGRGGGGGGPGGGGGGGGEGAG